MGRLQEWRVSTVSSRSQRKSPTTNLSIHVRGAHQNVTRCSAGRRTKFAVDQKVIAARTKRKDNQWRMKRKGVGEILPRSHLVPSSTRNETCTTRASRNATRRIATAGVRRSAAANAGIIGSTDQEEDNGQEVMSQALLGQEIEAVAQVHEKARSLDRMRQWLSRRVGNSNYPNYH